MFSYLWSVLCPTHQSVQHKLNKTLRSTEWAGEPEEPISHKNYLLEVDGSDAGQGQARQGCHDQVELLSYQPDCVNKLNNELI